MDLPWGVGGKNKAPESETCTCRRWNWVAFLGTLNSSSEIQLSNNYKNEGDGADTNIDLWFLVQPDRIQSDKQHVGGFWAPRKCFGSHCGIDLFLGSFSVGKLRWVTFGGRTKSRFPRFSNSLASLFFVREFGSTINSVNVHRFPRFLGGRKMEKFHLHAQ